MICRSELVLIRRVEILPSGKFGADFVTVGLLKYGLHRTRCNHWRMVRQSEPMSEKEAKKIIHRRSAMLEVGERLIDRESRRDTTITEETNIRDGGTLYKVNGKWLSEVEIIHQYRVMGEEKIPDDTSW